MGKFRQKKGNQSSSKTTGISGFGRGQASRTILPKQGRKIKNALTIFGTIIGRLANSAFFFMADNLLKRMKTCLQVGWNNGYMSKAKYFLTSETEAGTGGDSGSTGCVSSSNNHPTLSAGVRQAPTGLKAGNSEVDYNLNAKNSNAPSKVSKPGKKPCKGKARRPPARPVGRPPLKQSRKQKDSKPIFSDRSSEQLQKIDFLRKRCARRKREDDSVSTLTETHQQLKFIETPRAGTSRNKICNTSSANKTPSPQATEISLNENAQSHAQSQVLACKENKNQTANEKMTGKKRCNQHKAEALLNLYVTDPKKQVKSESKDTKQQLLVQKLKHTRKQRDRDNASKLSQPNVRPSLFSLNKTCYTNITDWPSLAEMGRPKGLIKEAATEIVKSKHGGSVARNARKLLADVSTLSTRDLSCQTTAFRSLKSQQHSTMNVAANHRSWASVAAQPLAYSSFVTSGHKAAESCHPDSAAKTEHTPNNPSTPGMSTDTKYSRKLESWLSCSSKLLAESYNDKEKRNSHKHFAESEDRTKVRKAIRCLRNKMKQRCGRQDPALVQFVFQEKRKLRKENCDGKNNKIKIRTRTMRAKDCKQQKWQLDTMQMVYTQPAGPVIVLNEHAESETVSKIATRSVAMTTLNGQNNTAATIANISYKAANDSELCACIDSLPAEFSNQPTLITETCRDDTNKDVLVTAPSSSINESQKTSPEEGEPAKQKKVSARYRALLRGKSGCLDAKNVTEIPVRSKKTGCLLQDKAAIRTEQRQQRHERQIASHNVQRFHAAVSTDESHENNPTRPVQSRCPYWLRSTPSGGVVVQPSAPSSTPLNVEASETTTGPATMNAVTSLPSSSSDGLDTTVVQVNVCAAACWQ